MTYLTAPPMFPTEYTAKEIVGDRNLAKFRQHYSTCTSGTNQGEFPDKRLDKEIGIETRRSIAETYKHLRSFGFYPAGTTQDGRVKIAVQAKSQCQVMMESRMHEFEGKDLDELKEMARNGYRSIVKSVSVKPLSDTEKACG